MKLTQAALEILPANVRVPTYGREGLANGWVHIGVGGFHRAHQAVYLDDLLERGLRDWAICGVGLLPQDRRMADALWSQDGLYTIVERSAHGDTARVIGSLTRYQLAPGDPESVLQTLAAPQTKIVSLTITEGGYAIPEAPGESGSDPPHGAFGYLTEALDRRRRQGMAPFTVLSCDNLQHNGDIARRAVLEFAARRDPSLSQWIEQNVTFPNSMVDRITPQTTDSDRALVSHEFGIEDVWPVVTEPFRQWIIEDRFCHGRPPLEDVGAQFTEDVHPYEMMKLRLLNAGHSAMGYLGYLAGYRLIPEVMADPLFQQYIARLMDSEVTPLLPPVPGIDLAEYKKTLLVRFANPTIKDQVLRICLDGSSKVPKFVLPSIREQLERGGPIKLLTLAVAGWFRFLSGTDEQGQPIPIDDPCAATLQERARQGGSDPRALLGLQDVFGDLDQSPHFVGLLGDALQSLSELGVQTTLTRWLA